MHLHIDLPIHVFTAAAPTPVDAGVLMLVATAHRRKRHYYAAHPPLRLLLVSRCGPVDAFVPGVVVDALVGWDAGTPGFVLPANEARQHTKITLLRLLDDSPASADSLAAIVAKAPRSDRPGGYLPNAGRPPLSPHEPSTRHTIRLTGSMAQWLAVLGRGNLSAGVRRAARLAGFDRPEDEP